MKSYLRAAIPNDRLLRATSFVIFLMVLCVGSQSVHADDYSFVGALSLVPAYGAHGPIPNYSGVVYAGDDYTESLSGSFGDAGNWGVDQYPYVSYDSSGNGVLNSSTSVPGPGDSVGIGGVPAGTLAPTEGPGSSYSGVPIFGYYTAGGYGTGLAGYTSDSFNVSGVGGTIANLSVGGPGTLSLSGLTATTSASFSSEGGLESLAFNADWATDPSTIPLYQFNGFSPSAQVITGGSLSTPSLTLSANTNLAPAEGYGADGEVPDPAADAGSLTIQGATLSGDVTQVLGVPAGTTADTMLNIQPVTMTSGATLNATTELDIVGADPTAYPSVTGTTTLSANASTINAGLVVIATGASGYGSGNPDAPAELDLANGSTMTITNGSLIVGDTGDGTMMVSGGSKITDQQAVIGNATDSTGTVTIDGSTWINNGYLSVGNNGLGTLTIQNGGQVTTTGQYGNIYIAGLAGSSDSSVTVTGSGSLLQSSGYFVVAQDGTGDGTGTLTVQDHASVVTGDVMYVGEVQGATGTVDISGGATVTNNTTGTYGTSSTILGVVAGSYGYLYVDGSGSKLESTGDMSIGYDGSGTATISGGGALVVDGPLVRVGRDAGSAGTLTVTGQQSSFTATNATIYIGYGGYGMVDIEDEATLTVMGTNIGGQTTGTGTLVVDGTDSVANLGDTMIGDGGEGTLYVTGGATVNTGNITIGAQAGDAGTVILTGANSAVVADGDMIVGNQATGTVELFGDMDGGAMLTVNSLTVGSGSGGMGTITIDGDSNLTSSGDAILAQGSGSQAIVTVGLSAESEFTVGGNLTIGESGKATMEVNAGSTLTVQGSTITIGDQSGGNGLLSLSASSLSFSGGLVIGNVSKGELDMVEGATNTLDGDLTAPSVVLGVAHGSTGTLDMDGQGTFLSVSQLAVGEGGKGTVTLTNQAVLSSSGEVTVADEASSAISSISVASDATLAVNSDLTLASGAIATMSITNAGHVTALGNVSVGDDINGGGVVTVSGVQEAVDSTPFGRSSLGYGGSLMLGVLGSGTLNVTGGALVAPTPDGAGIVDLAAQSGSTGNVTVSGTDSTSGTASELDANVLVVGGTMNAAGGTGNLTVSTGGIVRVSMTARLWPAGTINVSGGGTIIGNVVNAGGKINQSAGVINAGSTENLGTITQTGGTATLGPVTGTGSMFIGNTSGASASTTASGLNQSSITINSTGLLTINGGTANSVNALSIIGNGSLDLTNHHLFIDYGIGPDPIASIAAWIKSGFNGGTWNGTGIMSTNARTNSLSYGIGYADSADPGNPANLPSGTIEIMYTLLGDINLDGKVNGTDFNILAANFNTGGDSWDQGDFNYDGKVNGNDFVLLADNFNQFASQSAVSAADVAALDTFAAANGISLANVPEPVSAGMMAMVGLGILRRRRRSSRDNR